MCIRDSAHTTEQVKFDKRYFPQLCIDQPRLWWPNGDVYKRQGYNYGMQLLDKYFGDMYINLSISPVFPPPYSRR